MLLIMENEEEIFRAWLKKYVKEDKKITGRKISKKLNVTPPTVTAWHSGRKNYKGEKYFPHIPFEAREKIIKITGVSHNQIFKEGRDILSSRGQKTTGTHPCETCSGNIFKINNALEGKHLSIIRQFKNKELACVINEKLVELESLDQTALAEIIVEIKAKIKEAESTKKRTANGED